MSLRPVRRPKKAGQSKTSASSTKGQSAESSLKVDRIIKPVARLKRAHNSLVDLVKTATGSGGIKVTVSDTRMTIDASNVSAANVSELHFSNGSITVDIDANGIKLSNVATSDYVQITPTGSLVMSDASSGNTLTINQADMFYGNYTMREFTICDGGNTANVRILCSQNY